jgi:hypothetical protein
MHNLVLHGNYANRGASVSKVPTRNYSNVWYWVQKVRETESFGTGGFACLGWRAFNIGRPCSPPHPCWLLPAENTIKEKRLGCVSLSSYLFILSSAGARSPTRESAGRRRSRARVEISGRLRLYLYTSRLLPGSNNIFSRAHRPFEGQRDYSVAAAN